MMETLSLLLVLLLLLDLLAWVAFSYRNNQVLKWEMACIATASEKAKAAIQAGDFGWSRFYDDIPKHQPWRMILCFWEPWLSADA